MNSLHASEMLEQALHLMTIRQREPEQREREIPAQLRAANVLLVGINYAPEPTGIAPYTTGLAEHLATIARSVTVLTGVPHYPSWRTTATYQNTLRVNEIAMPGDTGTPRPQIIRLRHYVPSRQSALTRAVYEATFLANALAARIDVEPDLVIAVTPSLGGAVAAARIAKRYGVPLITVVQDLMAKAASQSGMSGGSSVAAATGRLEAHALTRSSQIAIVSEAFRDPIRAYGIDDERIHLLPNWCHTPQPTLGLREARHALGWELDPFIVAHTGNMGLKQDLGNVIEAARLLSHRHDVRFMLIGDGSQRNLLHAQAAGLDNVRFIDPLDAELYPLALSAADVLLVNERPSVGDMSLPSKLTSYFQAGRPVLAAVCASGATAAELARTHGAGKIVAPGSPGEVARAVLDLHDADVDRLSMSLASADYARTQLSQASSMRRLHRIAELAWESA